MLQLDAIKEKGTEGELFNVANNSWKLFKVVPRTQFDFLDKF